VETLITSLISGGIGAAVVGGAFVIVQVFLNKKLRTPADEETRQQNAITERNQLMAQYKSDAADAKSEASAARKEASDAMKQADETDQKLDTLRQAFAEFREEWLHWGYKAAATIRRLGTEEDIPKPIPKGLRV